MRLLGGEGQFGGDKDDESCEGATEDDVVFVLVENSAWLNLCSS
jgi:hypothetical protein